MDHPLNGFWEKQVYGQFRISMDQLTSLGVVGCTGLDIFRLCIRNRWQLDPSDRDHAIILTLVEYPDVDTDLMIELTPQRMYYWIRKTGHHIDCHLSDSISDELKKLVLQHGHLHWWKKIKPPLPEPIKQLLSIGDRKQFLLHYLDQDVAEVSEYLPIWRGDCVWIFSDADERTRVVQWFKQACQYIEFRPTMDGRRRFAYNFMESMDSLYHDHDNPIARQVQLAIHHQ